MSGENGLPTSQGGALADIRAQLEAKGLVVDERTIALIQVVLNVTQAKGPLISADEVARLQAFIPDAGERLMRRIETEQQHRHTLQLSTVRADVGLKVFGQVMGLVVSLTGLYVAYLLVYAGFAVPGAAMGIAALGYPTVALTLVGRKAFGPSISKKDP